MQCRSARCAIFLPSRFTRFVGGCRRASLTMSVAAVALSFCTASNRVHREGRICVADHTGFWSRAAKLSINRSINFYPALLKISSGREFKVAIPALRQETNSVALNAMPLSGSSRAPTDPISNAVATVCRRPVAPSRWG